MHFNVGCRAGMRTALLQSASPGTLRHGQESSCAISKNTPCRQTDLPSRFHACFMAPNSTRILVPLSLAIASFIFLRSWRMRPMSFPNAVQSSGRWLAKTAMSDSWLVVARARSHAHLSLTSLRKMRRSLVPAGHAKSTCDSSSKWSSRE